MKIEIRSATEAVISGYVNAVERDSRVLPRQMCPGATGDFVERVKAGTFAKAIARGHPIEVRFNHGRTLGTTENGSLLLKEDNIGLYAEATVHDPEVIRSARNRKLRGWSFGFTKITDDWEDAGEGIQRRTLSDIDLGEVSILTECPAYIGTSIEMRGESTAVKEVRGAEDAGEDVSEVPDYTARLAEIEILKLKGRAK
ncbi:MAG: HK97 family phage prohead protease [Clostridia bacterium]|nr:HK97 family phage prohead protease [Clostridia bacterium]